LLIVASIKATRNNKKLSKTSRITTDKHNISLMLDFLKIYTTRAACSRFLAVLVVLLFSIPVFSADDYLSEIEAETVKLDPGLGFEEQPDETGTENNTGTAEINRSREEFEAWLEEKYRGSFVFYSKLPQRSREEVFQQYLQGADLKVIRKTIVDRYLQR